MLYVAKPMRAALLVLVLPMIASCGSKRKTYDSEIKIVRLEVIRRDDKGSALATDVEMSFAQCPGDQRKTIRGDRAFSECILKHKENELVPVKILPEVDEHGDMNINITSVAGCEHRTDPREATEFTLVQECTELIVNSVKVGFHCDRKPNKALLDKCPWFRTR